MGDERQEITTIRKNKNETLHVAVEFYKSVLLVDVRSYISGKATRKGLALQPATWREVLTVLPEILDGIETANQQAPTL